MATCRTQFRVVTTCIVKYIKLIDPNSSKDSAVVMNNIDTNKFIHNVYH